MYRRNLKAIIVAFVLVSGFGIGTAAHVSAADTMSPQGAAQSKSVNQNVATGTKVVTGTVTDPSGETLIGSVTDGKSFRYKCGRSDRSRW